jgi:hypothetical protein
MNENKDTMSVVSEMMAMKTKDVNPLAWEYVKFMSKKYGFCGEIMVSAFAHYCQAILGLPCDNPEYRITDEGSNWFKENKFENIPHDLYPFWNWNENPVGHE